MEETLIEKFLEGLKHDFCKPVFVEGHTDKPLFTAITTSLQIKIFSVEDVINDFVKLLDPNKDLSKNNDSQAITPDEITPDDWINRKTFSFSKDIQPYSNQIENINKKLRNPTHELSETKKENMKKAIENLKTAISRIKLPNCKHFVYNCTRARGENEIIGIIDYDDGYIHDGTESIELNCSNQNLIFTDEADIETTIIAFDPACFVKAIKQTYPSIASDPSLPYDIASLALYNSAVMGLLTKTQNDLNIQKPYLKDTNVFFSWSHNEDSMFNRPKLFETNGEITIASWLSTAKTKLTNPNGGSTISSCVSQLARPRTDNNENNRYCYTFPKSIQKRIGNEDSYEKFSPPMIKAFLSVAGSEVNGTDNPTWFESLMMLPRGHSIPGFVEMAYSNLTKTTPNSTHFKHKVFEDAFTGQFTKERLKETNMYKQLQLAVENLKNQHTQLLMSQKTNLISRRP